MALVNGSLEHRLVTMRGQIDGLINLRGDGEAARAKQARLMRLIDGQWSAIRRRTIKEWLDECVDALPEEEREGLVDVTEALERMTGVV